jgi:hypothetical protein
MAETGGLVVVRGDPKSGKSRTLWEALASKAGSRLVYGLQTPVGKGHTLTPVRTFVADTHMLDGARSIIWIDDAHDHFGYGLTAGVLTRDLLARHPGVIVAMTVHTHRLRTPERAEGSAPVVEDPGLIRRLRDASEPYQLDVRWKDNELDLARAAYPGLEDTIDEPGDFATLARWFAGVNHLRKRYKTNRFDNPRGVAVAKAVIDWRRAGMPADITTDQLRHLARLERGSRPARDDEDTHHEVLTEVGKSAPPCCELARHRLTVTSRRSRSIGRKAERPARHIDPSDQRKRHVPPMCP